jgi:hypothetical protein
MISNIFSTQALIISSDDETLFLEVDVFTVLPVDSLPCVIVAFITSSRISIGIFKNCLRGKLLVSKPSISILIQANQRMVLY